MDELKMKYMKERSDKMSKLDIAKEDLILDHVNSDLLSLSDTYKLGKLCGMSDICIASYLTDCIMNLAIVNMMNKN